MKKSSARVLSSPSMTTAAMSTLTRDPISLILPFLTLHEFATSGIATSQIWYSTAQKMRSRHDRFTVKYINEQNQQQQQLFYSSSLRHHVTHLIAKPFEPRNGDAVFPSHQQQLNWLNEMSVSMSHLQSLDVKFIISPTDTSDSSIAPESIRFPHQLRCLKIETSMINEVLQKDPYDQLQGTEDVRFERWIVRLFSAVTNTESLCSSLRILESKVTDRMAHPNSVVELLETTALPKLTALRRLALGSSGLFFAMDEPSIDALRAIPQLSELVGTTTDTFAYLLRTPCQQSYREVGESALTSITPVRFGVPKSNEPSSVTNPMVHPDLLLASSAHSLIDLTATLSISPSFLPQFIRLCYLSLICRQDFNWTPKGPEMVPAAFDSEDIVSAVSQCRALECLIIEWRMIEAKLTESHLERLVAPLVHLSYLGLVGRHHISALSFMTRLPDLVYGLQYFVFVGSLLSLSEYQSIYSLQGLQLLCLDHGLSREDTIVAWEKQVGVEVLDAMFRPRAQVHASYSARRVRWDLPTEWKGPGQLPEKFCPHLRHFTQNEGRRKNLELWQNLVKEVKREREEELINLP